MNDTFAQALAGIMLLCAFALLMLRHPRARIALYRAQSLALTAAACWQGHTQHAAELYVTAVITLSANVLLLPRVLYPATAAAMEPALHQIVSSALGIILLGLAIIVIPASSANLGIPLAILLLGLSQTVTGRDPFAQTIGLLVVCNALLLTAITVPSLPFVPELAAALAGLAALPFLFLPRPGGHQPG